MIKEASIRWPRKCDLFGVQVSATTYDEVSDAILKAARAGVPAVTSFHAVSSVVTASSDPELRKAVNSFQIVGPDGQPVRWALNLLHRAGLRDNVAGPDMMLRLCQRAATEGVPIYLYGGSPNAVDALRANLTDKFPGLRIAGAESPPYRPLSAEEDEAVVRRINQSGAGIVFIGLGCPKQDRFAHEHRDRIDAVQVCVGAAFDFHAGTKRRAPKWMQRRGLEWLFRLVQEPRRLWRRYLVTNTVFLTKLALALPRRRGAGHRPRPGSDQPTRRRRSFHAPLVDLLRTHLSYDFGGRRYMKTLVEDTRTILRWPKDWTALETQFPKQVFVELTNICNANCIFCAYQYQDKFRATRGIMSDDIFQRTLQGCRECGVQEIGLTPLVGESLVDPAIVDRLCKIKQAGMKVYMFTNGIRLDSLDLERFVNTGINSVVLSVSPFDAEHHQLLYRSKQYDKLLRGVVRLLQTRNQMNSPLRILINFRAHIPFRKLIDLPDYRDKVLPLLTEEERECVYAQIKTFDTWGGQIRKGDLPGIMNVATRPRLKWRPCHWTFTPIVLWDGKVRACAARFGTNQQLDGEDVMVVGDLHRSSLKEIWEDRPIRDVRRRFASKRLLGGCRDCTLYRAC